jgi:hypothetical protein
MNKALTFLAVSAVGMMSFYGCSGKNPVANTSGSADYALASSYEDASSLDIAQDAAGMSQTLDYGTKSATLAKQSAAVSGTIQWQNWTYANSWWFRFGEVSLTSSDGAVDILGSDSVEFTDATNATVQYPLLADVRGCDVHHHAAMNLSATGGGYVDAVRDWLLSGSLAAAADTTLTLNGSLTQSFKAQNATKTLSCNFQGTATATDIVYDKQGTGWSKPVSGSVRLTSPYKTIDITFASGTAHVVVTATNGAVTMDTTVTL